MKALKNRIKTREYSYKKTPGDLKKEREVLLLAVAGMSETDLNELIIFNRQVLRSAFKHYASLEDKRETLIQAIDQLEDRDIHTIIKRMKSFQS